MASMDYSALFGSSSSTPSVSAYSTYQTLLKTGDKQQADFAKSKAVTREEDYFNTQIQKISTVDELFKDDRLVKYITSAFSMDTEAQYKGRLQKVVSQDRSDANSLVNKLTDPKFKQLADYLQIDTRGLDKLKLKSTQLELSTKYVQNEWEKKLGDQNPALREASYFARNVGSITSVYNLLSDSVFSDVVRTTLSLPKEIVYQSVETQAAAIEKRLDWKKFNSSIDSSSSTGTRMTAVQKEQDANNALLASGTNAQSSLSDLTSQLAALTQQAADLQKSRGGADPATAQLQTDNMPKILAADSLLGAANDALNTAAPLMQQLQDLIGKVGTSTGSELHTYQNQFNTILTKLNQTQASAQVLNTDTGATQSIFDSDFQDMTMQFSTDGTGQTLSRVSLDSLITTLSQASASFGAIKNKNDTTNINAATAKIATAMQQFTAVQSTVQKSTADLGSNVEAMGPMVGNFDSEQIGTGQSSVDDARTRLTRASDIVDELQDLAMNIYDPPDGYDTDAAKTQVASLRQQLDGLLDSDAGTNLLKGNATLTVNYSDGKSFTVQGFDLTDSFGEVAETVSGASDVPHFLNTLNTLKATLVDTSADLDKAARPLDMLSNTFDPGSVLAGQIASLTSQAQSIQDTANKTDGDPLATTARDVSQYSSVTGKTVTLHAEGTRFASVISGLKSAGTATGIDAIARQLAAANSALSTVNSRLNGDVKDIGGQGDSIAAWIKDNKTSTSTGNGTLQAGNAFTQKFIEKYLIASDTANGLNTNPYLQLFGGSSSSDGGSSLLGILYG